MQNKYQHDVSPPPLVFGTKVCSGQNRQAVHGLSDSLGQKKTLQVGGDGLPFGIVGVWQGRQRQFGGEEAIIGRDAVVLQGWHRGVHHEGRGGIKREK